MTFSPRGSFAPFAPFLVVCFGVLPACGGGATAPSKTPEPSAMTVAPPANRPAAPPGSVRRSTLREVLAAGPGALLQHIELEDNPVLRGGKFHGFRVAALRGDPTFWDGVDLQPGDVVTKVNGRGVEKPQDAFEAFRGLETAREIRVDYERAGEARTLRYDVFEDASENRGGAGQAKTPSSR